MAKGPLKETFQKVTRPDRRGPAEREKKKSNRAKNLDQLPDFSAIWETKEGKNDSAKKLQGSKKTPEAKRSARDGILGKQKQKKPLTGGSGPVGGGKNHKECRSRRPVETNKFYPDGPQRNTADFTPLPFGECGQIQRMGRREGIVWQSKESEKRLGSRIMCAFEAMGTGGPKDHPGPPS